MMNLVMKLFLYVTLAKYEKSEMYVYPIQKLCRSRCNTLEVQCGGW